MIKSFPHHIRDLVQLRYLWVQSNKLKEIPTQICRLRNLKDSLNRKWYSTGSGIIITLALD